MPCRCIPLPPQPKVRERLTRDGLRLHYSDAVGMSKKKENKHASPSHGEIVEEVSVQCKKNNNNKKHCSAYMCSFFWSFVSALHSTFWLPTGPFSFGGEVINKDKNETKPCKETEECAEPQKEARLRE